MWHLYHLIQKLPHIPLSPVDDGRYQKGLFAADATDGLLFFGIGDIHLALLSCARRFGRREFLLSEFLKGFQITAEGIVANFYLVTFGSISAFLMSDANERHLTGSGLLLELLTAPPHFFCR